MPKASAQVALSVRHTGRERDAMTAYDLTRATWWKSSRSGGNGSNGCVEVAVLDESVVWRKSSRSNGNGGNACVEVGFAGAAVGVRDTKDRDGGALAVSVPQWAAFIGTVKTGSLDVRF
jgi:hypothetical protein